ncbi:MAG: flagellar type III secretion system pore protein FliP [Rhodospirillales bacterium]|nr:flagellar type III secretion system pore protein FliP [Rhodospirillales bacterium]
MASVDLYTRFLIALALVVALIAGAAWAAKRFGLAGRITAAAGGRRRLAVVEVAPLDGKRRLVLLRRDDVEHLVVLGQESATVIETNISPPTRPAGHQQNVEAPAAERASPASSPAGRGARLAAAFLGLALTFLATPAFAQSMTIDFGDGGGTATGRIIQLMLLVTVLSLAPAILVTVTSFTRIIIVLSFVRNALGLQQTPPNTVLVSLALFLTGFVMAPTFETAWRDGIAPLIDEQITEAEAFERAVAPLARFMLGNVREQDVKLFADLAHIETIPSPEATPLRVLVPAFMISELRRAFEIGFLLFLPFLVIDMVVASILMSMGMMMLPSAMISLPFKVIFFVLVDGWYLVAGSLVQSFAAGG